MQTKERIEVTVVSHVHWDREWYRPFQEFRFRLVELIDRVLEILAENPEFKQFHLDGQTVVLEDYLEIRPDRESLLRKLIREGRLLVGPWYVLPDEFLVSGEALIRNLLFGHRIAEDFGHVMRVGYLPDQFSQISQMPQILRGFGLDSVILWRGLEYAQSVHNEFIWESPDGSQVLGIHLPPRGYGGLARLVENPQEAKAKIERLLEFLVPRSATGYVLVMNGDDHVFPEAELPGFLDELNTEIDGILIRQGSLEEYIDKVRSDVDEKTLSVVQGELISPKDTRVLQSVYSSRMILKQLNHACETALERWAEPTSVYRWWLGGDPRRGLVRLSWKWLLKNHPHDSICGCSIDQVHREMLTRFAWSKQIADTLTTENLRFIASKIDTLGILKDDSECAMIVFNPTNFPGTVVVEEKCCLPTQLVDTDLRILSEAGASTPLQVLSWERSDLSEPERHAIGQGKNFVKARVRFLAEDLPSNGYASYRVIAANKVDGDQAFITDLRTGKDWIENEYYKITAKANGTIEILDKEFGNRYSDCLRFEDQGDRGDEYTFDPLPECNPIYPSSATVTVVDNDPLHASLKIRSLLELPEGLVLSRHARSTEEKPCSIETRISLSHKVKRVDFEVYYTNTVRNHRLRVLFPSGVDTDNVHVEENFDIVTRAIAVPPGIGWDEAPYPTKHVNRFLYLSDSERGFALITKGLPEYEAVDDDERTVALTLLRSVGDLARPDLNNRKDRAGPIRSTPEAQCLGSHTFEFAVYTYRGHWEDLELLKQVGSFIAPPRIVTKGGESGDLPNRLSFFEVDPNVLELTALKTAEDRDLAILRVFNPTVHEQRGIIRFWRPLQEAFLLNLREDILGQLPLTPEGRLKVVLGPKEIKTIGIQLLPGGASG